MQFSFRTSIFWHPDNLQKHYFGGTNWHYLCFETYQKIYKNGEKL